MNRLYVAAILAVCLAGPLHAQTPSSILNATDPSLELNPAGITQVENFYLAQSFTALNNGASIVQSGNGNLASITQAGSNLAIINQVGQGNSSTILQTGTGNAALANVKGSGNTTLISQYGNYNAASQIIRTNSMTDQLYQTGNNNTVLDMETRPTTIPLKIIQSGNSSMAIQNGTVYILH